jgi:biotin carboxyl carrier protein
VKKFKITVNGEVYEVEVEEVGGVSTPSAPIRQASPTPAPSAPAPAAPKAAPSKTVVGGTGAGTVKAPMPGTILSIKVNSGQQVNQGDVLLILEAMKMENEVSAPVSGTVKAINATVGASVNPGDVLVVIE